jgi:hypothetical protein
MMKLSENLIGLVPSLSLQEEFAGVVARVEGLKAKGKLRSVLNGSKEY